MQEHIKNGKRKATLSFFAILAFSIFFGSLGYIFIHKYNTATEERKHKYDLYTGWVWIIICSILLITSFVIMIGSFHSDTIATHMHHASLR